MSSSEGVSVGLLLQAVDVAGPHRWRWLLVDERSGAALADHPVDLDPLASETEAFEICTDSCGGGPNRTAG